MVTPSLLWLLGGRKGTRWTQQAKFTTRDGAANDGFGISVAISGNTVIVEAKGNEHLERKDAGSAHIFVCDEICWTQQAKLIARDATDENGFGVSVAISGNTDIVGTGLDDDAGRDSGSAYIFEQ